MYERQGILRGMEWNRGSRYRCIVRLEIVQRTGELTLHCVERSAIWSAERQRERGGRAVGCLRGKTIIDERSAKQVFGEERVPGDRPIAVAGDEMEAEDVPDRIRRALHSLGHPIDHQRYRGIGFCGRCTNDGAGKYRQQKLRSSELHETASPEL